MLLAANATCFFVNVNGKRCGNSRYCGYCGDFLRAVESLMGAFRAKMILYNIYILHIILLKSEMQSPSIWDTKSLQIRIVTAKPFNVSHIT